MESILLAIDPRDPLWIAIAFAFGFAVKLIGLPPMVGFLIAGFVLHAAGAEASEFLLITADLGVTLLLFTIGLKLRLSSLARPEVWGVAGIHMGLVTTLLTGFVLLLAGLGLPLVSDIDQSTAWLIGFALSFSSTVFAVKILEEKSEMSSLHGRTAVGILIVQDVFAVLFLTFSTGKLPSPWAVALIGLYFARPLLGHLLDRVGHGELLPLFGLFAAVTLGAELFDIVNLKPDLGALILGMLMANHPRASAVAESLFSLKEMLLVGFFLGIGLAGIPELQHILIALLLVILVPLKSALFFYLLTRFRLRARSALLASFSLSSYSEFGLIVASIGVSSGWLASDWLVIIALALSVSLVIAAPVNAASHRLYSVWKPRLKTFEHPVRHPEDMPLELADNRVVIFGMGRVGRGAYDYLRERHGDVAVGIDFDKEKVDAHVAEGRNVLHGDATDSDFWDRIGTRKPGVEAVMLAMSAHESNLYAVERMRDMGFEGFIAAMATYREEAGALEAAGANLVVNIYAEAGLGFASEVEERLAPSKATAPRRDA